MLTLVTCIRKILFSFFSSARWWTKYVQQQKNIKQHENKCEMEQNTKNNWFIITNIFGSSAIEPVPFILWKIHFMFLHIMLHEHDSMLSICELWIGPFVSTGWRLWLLTFRDLNVRHSDVFIAENTCYLYVAAQNSHSPFFFISIDFFVGTWDGFIFLISGILIIIAALLRHLNSIYTSNVAFSTKFSMISLQNDQFMYKRKMAKNGIQIGVKSIL